MIFPANPKKKNVKTTGMVLMNFGAKIVGIPEIYREEGHVKLRTKAVLEP